MHLPGGSTRADFRQSPEYHAAAYLRPQVAANLAAPTRNRPRAAGQTDAGSDRFRLKAVVRFRPLVDISFQKLTLIDSRRRCTLLDQCRTRSSCPSQRLGPAERGDLEGADVQCGGRARERIGLAHSGSGARLRWPVRDAGGGRTHHRGPRHRGQQACGARRDPRL